MTRERPASWPDDFKFERTSWRCWVCRSVWENRPTHDGMGNDVVRVAGAGCEVCNRYGHA